MGGRLLTERLVEHVLDGLERAEIDWRAAVDELGYASSRERALVRIAASLGTYGDGAVIGEMRAAGLSSAGDRLVASHTFPWP